MSSGYQPKDGGPAFPVERDREFPKDSYAGMPKPGMSLRDYFAGQALAGLCVDRTFNISAVAADAYAIADAMLKTRLL